MRRADEEKNAELSHSGWVLHVTAGQHLIFTQLVDAPPTDLTLKVIYIMTECFLLNLKSMLLHPLYL